MTRTGTLKAKLNTEGVELLYEAAEALHVPLLHNGSMVCAFGEKEDLTVRVNNRRDTIVCVKTAAPVPKGKMMEVMARLRSITVSAHRHRRCDPNGCFRHQHHRYPEYRLKGCHGCKDFGGCHQAVPV